MVKISTKKNSTNMMTKTILVEKGKVKNELLGEPCEVTKRGESKVNEVEAIFYGGTQ